MRRKRDMHRRRSINVVIERSTFAIGAVCFLLVTVIVFATGYVAGVSSRRSSSSTSGEAHSHAAAPAVLGAASATGLQTSEHLHGDHDAQSQHEHSHEAPAQVEPLRSPPAAAPQFAYMSLSDLYRAAVVQGGTVEEVLETEADSTAGGSRTSR